MEFIKINLTETPYTFIFKHKNRTYEIQVTPRNYKSINTISDIKDIIKNDTEFQNELDLLKLRYKDINDEIVNAAVDRAFDAGKIFANPPVTDDRNTQTAPVEDDRNTQTAPVEETLEFTKIKLTKNSRTRLIEYNFYLRYNGKIYEIEGVSREIIDTTSDIETLKTDIKNFVVPIIKYRFEYAYLEIKDDTINHAVDKAFNKGNVSFFVDDRNILIPPGTGTLELTRVELDQRDDEVMYNIEGIFNGKEFSLSGDNAGFHSFYSEPTIYIDQAKAIIERALYYVTEGIENDIIQAAINSAFKKRIVKLFSQRKEIKYQTNESRKMIGKIIKEEVVKFLRRHR